MLKVLDIKYSNTPPVKSKYNALCVFSIDSAILAFNYSSVDFVFALNENTGKFAKCFNVTDVIDFFNIQ